MSFLELKRDPSAGDLRWFGVIMASFFGGLGGLLAWQAGAPERGAPFWTVGVLLALLYYAVPPLRRPLYALWMSALAPVAWLVSHALLAVIYFGLLTPIGWVLRAFRDDPLARRFEPSRTSYWIEEKPGGDPARYYRQS